MNSHHQYLNSHSTLVEEYMVASDKTTQLALIDNHNSEIIDIYGSLQVPR